MAKKQKPVPFDPTKPVETRDGSKARIICTDVNDAKYPIAALVEDGGCEYVETYTANGRYLCKEHERGDSRLDLINIVEKPRVHGFINVYSSDDLGVVQESKEAADRASNGKPRIACLEIDIEYELGQGLPAKSALVKTKKARKS